MKRYCACGRQGGRRFLGVTNPKVSLIRGPWRTLDCARASPAARLAGPGARRREYRFVGASRRPPHFEEESVMKALHRRCAGLDVHQQEIVACRRIVAGAQGSDGGQAVLSHDPRLASIRGLAGGRQHHARRHGGDRGLLEARLARSSYQVHVDPGQRGAHSQRSGPQERCERCDLDRRTPGSRPDPGEFRAATANSGIA